MNEAENSKFGLFHFYKEKRNLGTNKIWISIGEGDRKFKYDRLYTKFILRFRRQISNMAAIFKHGADRNFQSQVPQNTKTVLPRPPAHPHHLHHGSSSIFSTILSPLDISPNSAPLPPGNHPLDPDMNTKRGRKMVHLEYRKRARELP